MADVTDVILVTGFLGSGKTTLINRLIEAIPPGVRTFVLVNEFGEIGIDGALIDGDDFDLLEISKGSIFCICVKTDFIKALYRIASEARPDLLVMEATGVANPSDLRLDLQLPLFGGRFRLAEQICTIDAASFEAQFHVFASVERQIASSTLFVINKTDLADPGAVEEIKALVRAHHPAPQFLEAVRCDVPLDAVLAKLSPARPTPAGESPVPSLGPGEIESLVSRLDASPFRDLTPPDRLVSAAYAWQGRGLAEFRELIRELPRGIVRGKGFVPGEGCVHLVSLVMGETTFAPAPEPVPRHLLGTLVLIFPPELRPALDEIAARWSPCFAPLRQQGAC